VNVALVVSFGVKDDEYDEMIYMKSPCSWIIYFGSVAYQSCLPMVDPSGLASHVSAIGFA
jgi:hypothetical protein